MGDERDCQIGIDEEVEVGSKSNACGGTPALKKYSLSINNRHSFSYSSYKNQQLRAEAN
jgi:hypothetical protein